MKKTIIIVSLLLIAVLAVTLTGCSNTPAHKILKDTWQDYELVAYDVERILQDDDKDAANNIKISGEQTILYERFNNSSVTVGERTIDAFTGTAVTVKMTMNDGGYQNSKMVFDTNMRPVALSKDIFVKGYEHNVPATDLSEKISSEYIGKECRFTIERNGEKSENVTKLKDTWLKRPFFDVFQLYHVARASFSAKNAAFNPMTFDVPSYDEKSLRQASIGLIKTEEELKINDVAYKTSLVGIEYKKKPPLGAGRPIFAWFNNEVIAGHGGRVLMKMQEGDVTYTFKSISGKI